MDSLHRFSIERLTSPCNTASSSANNKLDWQNAAATTSFIKEHWQNITHLQQQQQQQQFQLQQNINEMIHQQSRNTTTESNASQHQQIGNASTVGGNAYYASQRVGSPNVSESRYDGVDSARGASTSVSVDPRATEPFLDQGSDSDLDYKSDDAEQTQSTNQQKPDLQKQDDQDEEEKEKKPNDPNEKPQHSYIALISMGILGCHERKLVLSDIYQYIMDNFPYYNNTERAWRNSIRHNLSLNECFIKAGRAENGKGNYWAIHPACLEDFTKGDYRRRHARRRARGGPYADINVSALPYNYRCNLGYVPMTPSTPPMGYPYHLPYLPSMSQRASASSLFSRVMGSSEETNTVKRDSNSMAAMSQYYAPGSSKETSKQGLPATATNNKNTGLLPHTYIPNMLSPSLRYSPYGFPFF